MVGRVGADTLTSRRCTGSPTAPCPWAARCTGTCSASIARCWPGCARSRAPGGRRRHRHRLLGDRLRPARRGGGAARQPAQPPRQPHRRRRRAGARTRSTRASCTTVTGLQQLPFNTIYQLVAALGHARAGAGRRRCCCSPTCWPTGSPARSAPSAPTPRPPACTTCAAGEWAARPRRPARPALVDPAAAARPRATVVGPVLPEVAAVRRRCPPTSRSSRSARTTPRRRSSASRPATSASPTSPPAPGRWSAWSSTRRCSPRRRGWPTSPTRAASTARSASSRT